MKTKTYNQKKNHLSLLRTIKVNTMKFYYPIIVILFVGMSIVFHSYKSGSPVGSTNAPGEKSCYDSPACHGGTPNTGTGFSEITVMGGVPANNLYVPEQTYVLMPYTMNTGDTIIGFQTVVKLLDGSPAGMVTITMPSKTQNNESNGYDYVTHTSTSVVNPGMHDWMYDWKAPAAGSGTVVIYGSFVSADQLSTAAIGNVYTDSLVLYEDTTNSIFHLAQQDDKLISLVYPLPAKDIVNIEINSKKEIQMDILNVNGEVVRSQTLVNSMSNHVHQLNIEGLTKGIYFLHARDIEDNISMRKIVKM